MLANVPGPFAVVERVHSMPRQGEASTFSFGCSFGVVLGVLGAMGIPFELVAPKVWKGGFESAYSNFKGCANRNI